MNTRQLAASIVSVGVLLSTAVASAQNCPPGSVFCGGVQVGVGGFRVGGGVQVGATTPPPPPPQPVAPPPPPATVVSGAQVGVGVSAGAGFQVGGSIQIGTVPPPPPIVYTPPPPPPPTIVYTPPPPPPTVVYVPPPQPVYVTTVTPVPAPAPSEDFFGRPRWAVGGFFSGMTLSGDSGGRGSYGEYGAIGSLRYRPNARWATDLSVGFYGGTDYHGDTRADFPVTVSEIFYLTPEWKPQFYVMAGLGLSPSFASYDQSSALRGGRDSGGYLHVGALFGAGVEVRLLPQFALAFDVRGFVRTRIDSGAEENPEYVRPSSSGRIEGTNTSIGATWQLGALWYF